jgi:PAS domain S-box-containing protein/putative nucleotidyltransferase with HDIG domain
MKVMIVEDEAIVALDIKNRLLNMGYNVTSVHATGERAVQAALEDNPNLVLMDIMLDGQMDGIETARAIRDRMTVPIIYLTAYADETTLDRAKATGPFGYIIKPFEDRELSINIEMALYKHRMELRMRENERWLGTTLTSIGDGVVATDPQGQIRFVNPVAARFLGVHDNDLTGRPLEDVLRLESLGTKPGHQETATESKFCPADGDYLLLGRDKKIPINLNVSPIKGTTGTLRGSVIVFRDETERFEHERALEQSVERLKATLQETVNALVAASEKRDPYTAGHQQRVAELACAIAAKAGFCEDECEGLRVGALLHDLGKIYVPAEILSKPSRLTDMEMGIMKTHPEVGYDIVKTIPFPWPVGRMVLEHHERLDGSGYPGGLGASEIVREARIIAVADVVEAMSSHRPYRAALGVERALGEIKRNRGVLYEPEFVDICTELFREGFRFKLS